MNVNIFCFDHDELKEHLKIIESFFVNKDNQNTRKEYRFALSDIFYYFGAQNPFVERFQQSLKSECLARIEFSTQETLREAYIQYQEYYNRRRPHQGIEGNVPVARSEKTVQIKQDRPINFQRHLEIGGLITRFSIAV